MTTLRIYTDGSYDQDNKVAGLAAVYVDISGDKAGTYSGMATDAHSGVQTSTEAELLAIRIGLIHALEPCDHAVLFTDCQVAHDQIRTGAAKNERERILVEEICGRTLVTNTSVQWVRSHGYNYWNDMADQLARKALQDAL